MNDRKLFDCLNFFSRDKYGGEVWKNNCLYCLYKYALSVNIIFLPLRGKCRHLTQNYDGKTKFWFSKTLLFFPIVFLSLNLCGSILYLYNMLTACKGFEAKCFLELHDHLVIISTIALMVVLQFKLRLRAKELNHLSHILEIRKYLGIRNLIPHGYGKKIYFINHLIVFVSGGSVFLFGLPYYINLGNEVLSYHFICLFLSQAIQLSVACQVSQKLMVLCVLYRSMHKSLKKMLVYKKIRSKSSLEASLKKTIHIYVNLKEVINKLCDFMNPTLIIWLTPHIIQAVFNTYVTIKVINIEPPLLIIFNQTKIVLSLLVIISLVTDCNRIIKEVSISTFKGCFQSKTLFLFNQSFI